MLRKHSPGVPAAWTCCQWTGQEGGQLWRVEPFLMSASHPCWPPRKMIHWHPLQWTWGESIPSTRTRKTASSGLRWGFQGGPAATSPANSRLGGSGPGGRSPPLPSRCFPSAPCLVQRTPAHSDVCVPYSPRGPVAASPEQRLSSWLCSGSHCWELPITGLAAWPGKV